MFVALLLGAGKASLQLTSVRGLYRKLVVPHCSAGSFMVLPKALLCTAQFSYGNLLFPSE